VTDAGRVDCLYCGKAIPDDASHCPHCGAVSHYQKKGYRAGARGRFVVYFIILAILCIFFALWLPR
jgi:predicted nucleic acid-binding Zn ribbon protein